MQYYFISFVYILFRMNVESVKRDFKNSTCDPNSEVCEYWLTIEEKLTMIHNKDLVYGHKGQLYKYYDDWSNASSTVPIEEVITTDGYHRLVIAFNDSIPGPPIIVYEGQMIVVHIKNKLLSESTSIHWHGLHQKGTPWMDGVAYISQCPIGPGQVFTYKFKASNKGTHWYHSHIGAQRSNGAFGALIIKERQKENASSPRDMIATVGDWHHLHSSEVYVRMVHGNFVRGKKFNTTSTLDGGHFSGVPWVSGLIEGKGRLYDPITGKPNEVPLTWYNVNQGETVRFRVIAVGVIYPLRISVDQHYLTMVSSDGHDVENAIVESFIINPGERFDFLLTANQSIGNYWFRAVSMENKVNHSVEAILHYIGTGEEEPTTKRIKCTKNEPCVVLNCPFLYFPAEQHTICRIVDDLQAKNPERTPEFIKGDSEEYFLNFHFPGIKYTPGAINGHQFSYPGISSLTQFNQIDEEYKCKNKDCGVDKVCQCHHELELPYNKTIQMIWLNLGRGKGWSHPIHIHGHSFYLLKMGYPVYDNITGKLIRDNSDIECGGDPSINFCNNARWARPEWRNGNIPGLNLDNPTRRDTIIIPTGGYAVLRIRSDNPGKWFLHCHIEVHALDGMAMVINEAIEHSPPPPVGFPVCSNFYHDPGRDIQFTVTNKGTTKEAYSTYECSIEIFIVTWFLWS